jgi:hypothetical protein
MGMETLIYFPLNGTQVYRRADPNAGAQDGRPLRREGLGRQFSVNAREQGHRSKLLASD